MSDYSNFYATQLAQRVKELAADNDISVYKAEYHRQFGRGAREEHHYVIIANTESEALGVALSQVEGSRVRDWEINEVDTSVVHADYITGRSS